MTNYVVIHATWVLLESGVFYFWYMYLWFDRTCIKVYVTFT
jgi:hypothetical protein